LATPGLERDHFTFTLKTNLLKVLFSASYRTSLTNTAFEEALGKWTIPLMWQKNIEEGIFFFNFLSSDSKN